MDLWCIASLDEDVHGSQALLIHRELLQKEWVCKLAGVGVDAVCMEELSNPEYVKVWPLFLWQRAEDQ